MVQYLDPSMNALQQPAGQGGPMGLPVPPQQPQMQAQPMGGQNPQSQYLAQALAQMSQHQQAPQSQAPALLAAALDQYAAAQKQRQANTNSPQGQAVTALAQGQMPGLNFDPNQIPPQLQQMFGGGGL